jgi:hypothetical protein
MPMPMHPLLMGSLLGLGAGAAKTMLFDEPARKQELKYQATTQALSPWTGLKATMPENKAGENLFSGAATGLAMGMNYDRMQKQQDTQDWLLGKKTPAAMRTAKVDEMMAQAPKTSSLMPSTGWFGTGLGSGIDLKNPNLMNSPSPSYGYGQA